MRHLPFERLVREIAQDLKSDLRFNPDVLFTLRVLISDDKSAFCHCVHIMSNTNVARIRLFDLMRRIHWQDSPVTI
jgi:hypothetical protein